MNSTDYNDTFNEDFDDDNNIYGVDNTTDNGVISKAPKGYIKEESRIAIEH